MLRAMSCCKSTTAKYLECRVSGSTDLLTISLAGLFICPNKCWLVIMARTKIRWGHYSDSRPNVVTLV